MTPRDFMAASIKAHEGGLSMNKNDNGNWFDKQRYKQGLPQQRNKGKLVGSKYGVTAYALARYRNDDDIEAWEIAGLEMAEAVDIAEHFYIKAPRFNLLEWNRVTASVIDKGWLSGPVMATKLLQRLIGAGDDGKVGGLTAAAYAKWIAEVGEATAARRYAKARADHETHLATNEGPKDPDRIFLNGWHNRTDSFLPGTKWWTSW